MAQDVVKAKAVDVVIGQREVSFSTSYAAERIVDALSAAGCLRTGVERECVEACKKLCAEGHEDHWYEPLSRACKEAGRAALAAEKPRERWTVNEVPYVSPGFRWVVLDGVEPKGGFASAYFRTESDARAYAASKNALEARP